MNFEFGLMVERSILRSWIRVASAFVRARRAKACGTREEVKRNRNKSETGLVVEAMNGDHKDSERLTCLALKHGLPLLLGLVVKVEVSR